MWGEGGDFIPTSASFENLYRRQDGSVFPAETRIAFVTDAYGNVRGI